MKTVPILLLAVLPLSAPAQVVISELDLSESKVELVNIGDADVDLLGYRWCNRVNGNPFYPGVSALTIDAANSTATGLLIRPGEIITFTLTSAFLPAAGGELGLYLPSGGFGSRAAMVDYLNWGTSVGIRDSAASDPPAIWVLNTSINIGGMEAGETIQLKQGAPGDSVDDYEVAPSTIGTAQSLETGESELLITGFGFADPDTFFLEFVYTGSGTIKITESADLNAFTDVSDRTTIASPAPNRFEFAVAGSALYFRLEEE